MHALGGGGWKLSTDVLLRRHVLPCMGINSMLVLCCHAYVVILILNNVHNGDYNIPLYTAG
jgi:hypothetical protein